MVKIELALNCFQNKLEEFRSSYERRIQNPVKHVRWSLLQKYLTAESHKLFVKKSPFLMFDSVLNTPVHTMISPQIYIFEYLSGILV